MLTACGGGGGSGSSSTNTTPEPQASQPPVVSWYSTAKPLIQRYCSACHWEDGVAPFPLETYEQVYSKRSALVYSLEADTMPPQGFADLSEADRDLLLQWANDGAPRGDISQEPSQPIFSGYSYHADIRPLLEQHCIGCHQQGGIAPFPLDTFEQLRGVAAAVAFSLEQGTMPPWSPTQGYTELQHARVLAPEEKVLFLDWLAGDMVEGDPGDYVPPALPPALPPSDFNLRLQLPQAYTPNLRPDDHRCFAIEWPLDDFAYVTDVDVLPDQLEEVHHVIVSIAEPEDAEMYYAADGQDGAPGWYCLGAGGVSGAPLPRQIGGWVPGAGREPTPGGTGVGVKPGSVMVVQMHYNTLSTEPTPDQSTVLLATTEQVERPASGFLLTDPRFLGEGGMPIPARDPDVSHQFEVPAWGLAMVFGEDALVAREDPWAFHTTQLHMHNLGTRGRITLLRENGTRQVLLDVADWDFNWQGTYRFAREVLVQPRDRIKLECSWDNSQANQPFVNGVQLKSGYVEWGDGTQDEMCLTSVYMTRPLDGYDYSYSPTVHIAAPTYRQVFSPGDLVPLRLLFNNFELHDPGEHNHNDPTEHTGGDHGNGAADHSGVYAGHYHVYLDSNDDDAEHLTAWDDEYYFQLPEAQDPGVHELRVSLRGTDHHALGVEKTVEIEVFEATEQQSLALASVDDWRIQDVDADALAEHRPETVDCQPNSWYEEDGALEVETGYCNYLSLSQASKAEIVAGDQLHLVLWHGDLAFEEPAVAHVAVSIAGKLVWEQEVEIPSEAEIFDLKIPLPFDAQAGSELVYHLHNHGYNTWTLLKLEVVR
jgi:Copper type II ascorbate-dependent monooxygenase, C-terminal domain